ncbi:MAG: uroporphyrinogen decarboxylase family protein [Kiritimatiellia bacterium]|jgi:uroporphyrinogen decarboxylase|nr:uroporphyrinogen decarboxylase family protein [Kiritimatiellia bacterium]MDP6629766.1 uroporphyrinogen decarboxylase family protein [Kiritimatiellia bacterium]MDP6811042.1 uroporphyrinogen decarboxylase family protein [Kiritimatiellia bacterium]MDP7023103.1 uroporphyrinogen decarboxylase family protein [Kiritimatiellia bacterium]
MNARERFLAATLFGSPDRVPLDPGCGRESTRARWHSEGLPEDVGDYNRYAYELAGGALPPPESGPGFAISERMIPTFEEKVIEEKSDSRIVQDWKGNVCEIGKQYTVEYLRNAMDFVTRRWIKCPVENDKDWQDMKRRYDPDAPERLPPDADELKVRLPDREYPITFHFSGPFWQLREWLGFEELCMAFYDKPQLVQDMLDFWCDYVLRLMRRGFEYVVPDCVHLSEDMAYKKFSMISPEMTRRYLLPVWRKWGEAIRGAGVPVYAIDSDGFIGELIPIWMEAGVNACDPIEVAAGNDIVQMRREFGRDMAFRGGVDKRAMAKGGAVIESELARLAPVVADGGFIPSCDHGVPADVSWPDYCHYVALLARMTGWLD